MSFFSEASLAMIPSGYKTSKVYSALPITGDGDLTFSRSNDTATRVGPDGLIEKVRTNLQTYSQDFSNAVWVKSAGATLTHSQTDPNGGTTASRLQMPSGTSNYFAASAISGLTNGGQYTHSIYMKSNTGSTQSVRILDGVRGAAGGTLLASVTTSWQRFEVVITTASTSAGLQIDNVAGTYNNDILIAFAQTEVSDFGATSYIATTSAAVSVGPVANVPRLDYLDSSSPRLLLEPQRTNLITFSEQFDNAAYNKGTGGSVSANTVVAPDGTTSADAYTFASSASTFAYLSQQVSSTSTLPHTFSIYIKRPTGSGSRTLRLVVSDVSATTGTSSNFTITESWQRFEFTRTSGSSTGLVGIGFLQGTTGVSIAAGEVLDLWGAQLEASAAYASSYIPTLGAAVTRGVDAMSKSSYACGITTEATLFADFEYQNTGSGYSTQFLIYNVSAGDYMYLTVVNNSIRAICVSAGVLQSNIILGSTTAGTRYKAAARFKQNDFALYVNGTLVGTDTSGTMPTFSTSGVTSYIGNDAGSAEPAGYVNQYIAFPTALSNSDLAALTA
jgi:hypothetical protein